MACTACGGTIDLCDNENCLNDLEGNTFYCHDSNHFCSVLCWQGWIANEERQNLKVARDDDA